MKELSRREFMAVSARTGLAAVMGVSLPVVRTNGPSIYWSGVEMEGLRSVADVRRAVRSGRSGTMYSRIKEMAERDRDSSPLTPSTPLPNRDAASIRDNSPDFWVTHGAGQRMLRSALVAVLEDDPSRGDVAIEQMEALFNSSLWEGWIDKAHLRFGHPAGLRTGMLAESVGLSFDWLRPYLSQAEQRLIVEGLDRCAIQPFLKSEEQDAWWLADQNNWLTTIVGGIGIAAMAMGDAHPESGRLVAYASSRMEEYLTIYGQKGEFNESVHYANATLRPVAFFEALRYRSAGAENPLAKPPFPDTCRWQLYLTLPPGRIAAFGDARPEARPWTKHVAAVAAAARDRVLQWYYLTYPGLEADPIELLWFDESLDGRSPDEAGLPLSAVFPEHGGCAISRSDWDPTSAACIVYGKAGREENHEHNDVGQICIDGNGERLIIDIGSPKPTYPADFFDDGRYEYYNASVLGHNVLMIDGHEQRFPKRERGVDIGSMARERSGRISMDPVSGGSAAGSVWRMDLTPAYETATRVARSVIHFLPGIVVVIDEAQIPEPADVSLRWHTINAPVMTEAGSFGLETKTSRLTARIVSDQRPTSLSVKKHDYRPPYDRGRGDLPLKEQNEPYVETVAFGRDIRFVSMFAVTNLSATIGQWEEEDSGWVIVADDCKYRVGISDETLSVANLTDDTRMSIGLP